MNQKKYFYFALLIFLVLCGSFALQAVCSAELNANDSNVTQANNILLLEQPNSSDVLKADNEFSFTQLDADIGTTGDVVVLTKNYTYTATAGDTDTGITISRAVTINGNGNVIIDGKNIARIFNIDNGATVTLKGITFINAFNVGNGGAISVGNGILNLENCNFINNSAGNRGGAIYINQDDNTAGPYSIKDCNFINNTALRDGIINSENANKKFVIENSVFENNTVQYGWGGALRLSANSVTIKNSNFRNNTIANAANGNSGYGAALYATGQDIIENCNFTDNTINGSTSLRGGAVVLVGDGNTISNCIFANNSIGAENAQEGLGGALYVEGQGSINNCNFTGNSVEGDATWLQGGAIVWKNSDSEIQNCYFADNLCGKEGGALFYAADENTNTINIKKSTFKNNTANKDGGAIFASGRGTIEDCNFTENSINGHAELHGGAVCLSSRGNNIITNSIFANNSITDVDDGSARGAAIYIAHNDGTSGNTITNSIFVNNSIDDLNSGNAEGGAVYIGTGSGNTITNSIFANNSITDYNAADGLGGALYIDGQGKIDNCNFTGNSVKGTSDWLQGGAIMWRNPNSEIQNCYFADNFCEKEEVEQYYLKVGVKTLMSILKILPLKTTLLIVKVVGQYF